MLIDVHRIEIRAYEQLEPLACSIVVDDNSGGVRVC